MVFLSLSLPSTRRRLVREPVRIDRVTYLYLPTYLPPWRARLEGGGGEVAEEALCAVGVVQQRKRTQLVAQRRSAPLSLGLSRDSSPARLPLCSRLWLLGRQTRRGNMA